MTEEGFDKVPQIGSANITIKMDGKELVLKPSLYAATTLSRGHNGLSNVINKLSQVNIDVIQQVIELGIQFKGGAKERQRLAEMIYKSGLTADDETGGITGACIDYIGVLMRGGRPLPPRNPEDDTVEPGEQLDP